MASKPYGTLYTGVTSDFTQRVHQHRTATTGLSARYACKLSVWYERHDTIASAIAK